MRVYNVLHVVQYLLLLLLVYSDYTESVIVRCFSCRSRGELGSCRDHFKYSNVTELESDHGVQAVPCASGWCGKVTEGGSNSFKDEEYGSATERMCLQRGPSDGEGRCAPTVWGHEKVLMCFCQGDLCNSTNSLHQPLFLFILLISAHLFW